MSRGEVETDKGDKEMLGQARRKKWSIHMRMKERRRCRRDAERHWEHSIHPWCNAELVCPVKSNPSDLADSVTMRTAAGLFWREREQGCERESEGDKEGPGLLQQPSVTPTYPGRENNRPLEGNAPVLPWERQQNKAGLQIIVMSHNLRCACPFPLLHSSLFTVDHTAVLIALVWQVCYSGVS